MDWTQTRIGVLMGGWSAEREVSLNSGTNVLEALLQKNFNAKAIVVDHAEQLLESLLAVDAVFNCLHGGFGENGSLQAMLDVLNIPYTGSGMLPCALAMHKLRAKHGFQQAGLTVPDHEVGIAPDHPQFNQWQKNTVRKLKLPIVVKPVHEGSSLGIHIVHTRKEFADACRLVHQDFGAYFAEAFIPGKEITGGVLWMEGKNHALPLLEMQPKRDFYDYEAKYTPGMTNFIIPTTLDKTITNSVQEMAVRAHEALECFGYSRADFRVTDAGDAYLLEVNTSPGMTNTSDLPQEAAAAGIEFAELVSLMMHSALKPTPHQPVLSATLSSI